MKENEEPNQPTATECFASELIKWVNPIKGWDSNLPPEVSPHIICLAAPLKHGAYYVRLHGHLIYCGQQAALAVDVFVKSFTVLGTKSKKSLAKFLAFLEVSTYKVQSYSTRGKVNSLVEFLSQLDDDDGESESDVDVERG